MKARWQYQAEPGAQDPDLGPGAKEGNLKTKPSQGARPRQTATLLPMIPIPSRHLNTLAPMVKKPSGPPVAFAVEQ